MTPAQWAQMKEVFSSALEMAEGERDAYLDEACRNDASLLQEVKRLLMAADASSLASPVAGILTPEATPTRTLESSGAVRGTFPALGDKAESLLRALVDIGSFGEPGVAKGAGPASIGRYRILSLLGEGGMGAVYEAEQEEPRRKVALKVIKTGFASAELLRRFHHESQLLGRLQHPGIAQIYEAATANSGSGPQPYFAMEFIRGAPLLQYADEHHLNTRQRLELLARVCEAVHHAHQRGIIHRDLKPANILVDETGQPKILDFGVARATDADAQATRLTDVGQLVGTLAYMSPEQVLADPLELDTRSDVYALGVILFELLAGRLPYKISRQMHEAVRTIREEDPAPLSSVSRTYRGDIETIVAKALEKDKACRYSSAAELAADIRRYLKDEPIVARRPTAMYQLQKFARRHTALVAGVAAVFAVLAAGVITSTWEATRARRAEQDALHQRDAAGVAERAAEKERDRAVKAEHTATAERNRSSAAEMQAVRERNRAVEEKKRADTESATAKAINAFLQNDLLAQASANAQARPDTRPDPDLKVRTALDRAAARISGRFDRQPLVEASIRQTIGDTYRDLGLYAEAQRQVERALDLRQGTLGEQHLDTLYTMHSMAVLYQDQGKFANAERLFTRVLEARRRLLGEWDPHTLDAEAALAVVYRQEGKLSQAEPLYIKTLEGRGRALGWEHPATLSTMNNLAVLYKQEGKLAEAEPLYIKALGARRRVLGEEHPNTLMSMNNLAQLYKSRGNYAQAEPLLSKALDVSIHVLGEEHPNTLVAMTNLAGLYVMEGQFAKAEPLYVKAWQTRRRILGEEHVNTLISMTELAMLYRSLGKYAEAESLYHKVLEVRRRVPGEQHPETLATMRNLALLYLQEGKDAEAELLLTRALEVGRRALGPEHSITKGAMTLLAKLRLAQHKYVDAESLLREAMRGQEETASGAWEAYDRRSLLGFTLLEQSKFSEAEPLLISGYEGLMQQRAGIPESRSFLEQAVERIVQLYENWGKPEKAAEWREELRTSGSAAWESKQR